MAVNEPDAATFVTTMPRSTRPVGGGVGSLPHPAAAPSTATNPRIAKTRAPEAPADGRFVGLVRIMVTARSPLFSASWLCNA
jgi:hypothetical protein